MTPNLPNKLDRFRWALRFFLGLFGDVVMFRTEVTDRISRRHFLLPAPSYADVTSKIVKCPDAAREQFYQS